MGMQALPGLGHVCLVDDDSDIRVHVAEVLRLLGYSVSAFSSAEAFLQSAQDSRPTVLLLDMRMPGMSGLELHTHLVKQGRSMAVIYASGQSHPQEIVDAMKLGAIDFLCKPFSREALELAVAQATQIARSRSQEIEIQIRLTQVLEDISNREREILALMVEGMQNRHIAQRLGIKPDTVKKHRAVICEKFCVHDTASLIAMFRTGTEPSVVKGKMPVLDRILAAGAHSAVDTL